MKSHYDWLDENFPIFLDNLGLSKLWQYNSGIITSHGDKCYGYRYDFEQHGIPFEHGVAVYLLSYMQPFSSEVRNTENGWVDPFEWILENYETRFKSALPAPY